MKIIKGGRKVIYLYVALSLVVVAILVVLIGGSMLPVQHSATVSRVVPGTPERVWSVLTDVEHHKEWRPELISVAKTSDQPLAWTEKSKFGEMPFRAEVFEPLRLLVCRIEGKNLPFGGTWTYRLEPADSGTKITITEDGEVYPPAFRFLSKFVFGHTKTIEGFLASLSARMAKEAN